MFSEEIMRSATNKNSPRHNIYVPDRVEQKNVRIRQTRTIGTQQLFFFF